MDPFNYTDEHGVTHVYPSFTSRWCDAHQRECWPWKPVTVAQVVEKAARDEALPDGAFTRARRALANEPITEQGE